MMKSVSYYPKGTTVYYFLGIELTLKETIVEDVTIKVDEMGEAEVTYKLDSGSRNHPSVRLHSSLVFHDREELKERVLDNFGGRKEEVSESEGA